VAFFTLRGASVYLYFSSLPIDLRVVVLEPSVAEDHALLSKARDSKKHSFGVGLVMENYIVTLLENFLQKCNMGYTLYPWISLLESTLEISYKP